MTASRRRFALRAATSAAHGRLDRIVGAMQDAKDYGRYLKGLMAGRLPLEATLTQTQWPSAFGDWKPYLIGAELLLDHKDLGMAPLPLGTRQADHDLSALLGMLYVLEGSTLGARILYGRAQELGFSASFGARHLAAQAGTAHNWKAFLDVLDLAADYDEERAAESAIATFGWMQAAMEGPDVEA